MYRQPLTQQLVVQVAYTKHRLIQIYNFKLLVSMFRLIRIFVGVRMYLIELRQKWRSRKNNKEPIPDTVTRNHNTEKKKNKFLYIEIVSGKTFRFFTKEKYLEHLKYIRKDNTLYKALSDIGDKEKQVEKYYLQTKTSLVTFFFVYKKQLVRN